MARRWTLPQKIASGFARFLALALGSTAASLGALRSVTSLERQWITLITLESLLLAAVAAAFSTRALTAHLERDRAWDRFRTPVDNVREYAIIGLDPQGRVRSWNAGAERQYGLREVESLGQPVAFFEAPGESRLTAQVELARRTGRAEGQGWHRRKDGSRFYADVVLSPVREVGFSLENQARIFERFERAVSTRHFGGLGLYIARQLAEADGSR